VKRKDESIDRVLIAPWRIRRRVRRIARQVERDFAGRDLVIVAVLKGCVLFLADLLRHLEIPATLDFVEVSSYREGTQPGGLVLVKPLSVPVMGRSVLLVDDILDTGRTADFITRMLEAAGASEVRTCFLLAKNRTEARGDYVGFQVEDLFVVGYGLDHAERFRHLPYIAALRSE